MIRRLIVCLSVLSTWFCPIYGEAIHDEITLEYSSPVMHHALAAQQVRAGNVNPVETSKNYEVYIGYNYTSQCKVYLSAQEAQSPPQWLSTLEDSDEPSKELRDKLIQVMANHIFAQVASTASFTPGEASVQSIRSNSFYDATDIIVPGLRISSVGEQAIARFQWLKHIGVDRAILPRDVNPTDFIESTKAIPCVSFVELPPTLRIEDPFPGAMRGTPGSFRQPDDTSLSRALQPNDSAYPCCQWYQRQMRLDYAWNAWTGPGNDSTGGVVAVVDTGCDVNHPDLAGRFWRNRGEICNNGIDDDNNGYIDDCHGWNFVGRNSDLTDSLGHGTAVASAVTANTNNNYGIAGGCWSCKVMCLKVGEEYLSIGGFAEAVNYARGFGIKIINFSAGGGHSPLELQTVTSARNQDVMIVVAAGNAGCNIDSNSPCSASAYPARYNADNLLTVGATDNRKLMSAFSNYGQFSVDVFAPGTAIYLASPTKIQPSGFKEISGTSFSSPLAAGVAALIRSRYPCLTYTEVIRSVTTTCTNILQLAGKAACPGIVNAERALAIAGDIARRSPSCHDRKTG